METVNITELNKNSEQAYAYWVKHAFANWGILKEYADKGRVKNLMDLHGKREGSVIVVGSGPTLDKAYDSLSKWKGEIICGNSNSNNLLANGIKPDFICMCDGYARAITRISPKYIGYRDIPLITTPEAQTELISQYPGDIYLYLRHTHKTGDSVSEWLNRTLIVAYALNKEFKCQVKFLMLGSVLGLQIQFSQWLGYKEIYLVGADFGFVDNQERCSDFFFDGAKLSWEPIDNTVGSTDPKKNKRYRPDDVPTDEFLIMSKINILAKWGMSKTDIYECSDGSYGTLRLLPRAKLADVVAGTHRRIEIEPATRQQAVDKYMIDNGMQRINWDKMPKM